MEMTPEKIRHIAELARLQLSGEEEASLARDIDEILAYVESISELDLPPDASRAEILPREWREDQVEPSIARDEMLDNAAETRDGQVVVPPVLPGQEEDA